MNHIKKYYGGEIRTRYGISRERREKIFGLVGDIEGKNILDIGCGDGALGKELKARGGFVIGVDISGESVEAAKKVLDTAIAIDLQDESAPYPNGYFDIIIMTEVIEHLFFPERMFAEAKRLLKDDGFMVVTTPNFLLFSNRIKILLGRFNYTEGGFLDRGHIHFFHIDSFEEIVSSHGLKIDQYDHVYYGKVAKALGRILPKLFAFQIVAKVSKKHNI